VMFFSCCKNAKWTFTHYFENYQSVFFNEWHYHHKHSEE
jgi:hypothetical protein